MTNFKLFQDAVSKQFEFMRGHELFRVDVSKDEIWDTYLKSFPAGTNPIFKTRCEYDCNCCKSFLRAAGGLVAITNSQVISIWDVDMEDSTFSPVAAALSALVKSKPICDFFRSEEPKAGTKQNRSLDEGGKAITWNHFHLEFPRDIVMSKEQIGPVLNDLRTGREVMLRGLQEIKPDAVESVLELIAQNSLYRGEEHKASLESFQKLQKKFNKMKTDQEKEIFTWSMYQTAHGAATKIKNTSIGKLLMDISEGKELDAAVASFETMVAPANYKRPTAVVTKGMIQKAQKTLEELGLVPALERRFATLEDLTVNNILFVERSVKSKLKGNVFDDMAAGVKENPKSFDKVEEVSIDDFLTKIMPRAESLEVMLENRHTPNLVSLVAPVHEDAKRLFKSDDTISFVTTSSTSDAEARSRFDIVKFVIDTKVAENTAEAAKRTNAEKKQRLLGLLENKENEALTKLSADEIRAQIAAL